MSKLPFLQGSLSKSSNAVAVILAGGSGTRFWPVSRSSFPKQFLPFGAHGQSLLQETQERVQAVVGATSTLVVTTEYQSHLVAEQLPQAAIIAEPAARNTGACIGTAAMAVQQLAGDVPMICLPADHMIWRPDILQARYAQACVLARKEDALVTIGIPPTSPETGYGYIEAGEERAPGIFCVKKFYEKPDLARARQFLASGNYLWNSGMFIWRPSVILKALKEFQPELFQQLEALFAAAADDAPQAELQQRYSALPSVSIDIGVMEKADNVLMLSGEGLRWSDVGSWHSWVENEERASGTGEPVSVGDGIFIDTERCALFSKKSEKSGSREPVVALVGVHDLVVVQTDDAILVCHRSRAQDVKRVVDVLKERGRNDLL